MRGEKEEWTEAHEAAADALMVLLKNGLSVAYPVLGDPSLYASSGYLLQRIEPHHPCEVIPGVPAMCAAAARIHAPLAESRETLTILPGYEEGVMLPRGNVVVMKAGRSIEALKSELARENRAAWVVQNLGMQDENVSLIDCFIPEGKQSYFTTVLIREKE